MMCRWKRAETVGERADCKNGLCGGGRTSGAMGKRLESQRQAGNNKNKGQVSEQPGANLQSFLLQAGVDAGSEGDISHFNQNKREAAEASVHYGCKVHNGAGRRAEQGALPVPTGKRPNDKGRTAGRSHVLMVEDALQMQHHGTVTFGLRMPKYRNQVDSVLWRDLGHRGRARGTVASD